MTVERHDEDGYRYLPALVKRRGEEPQIEWHALEERKALHSDRNVEWCEFQGEFEDDEKFRERMGIEEAT